MLIGITAAVSGGLVLTSPVTHFKIAMVYSKGQTLNSSSDHSLNKILETMRDNVGVQLRIEKPSQNNFLNLENNCILACLSLSLTYGTVDHV